MPFSQQDRVVCEDYAQAPKASARGAEGREVRRLPGNAELEEALRLAEARELVLTQVVQLV